jgi:isoprenylcysteine carboxyl methyltransferase (ICMT) family protein YpbQ
VVGRFLFRWRGVIGFAAFWVVLALGRPSVRTCLMGVPFLLTGLALRFWAMGFIGPEARAREIGASRLVTDGPYRWLRHPLYLGNFLLVAGMLMALRPVAWLALLAVVLFLMEYWLIGRAEERFLGEWRIANGELRTGAEGTGSVDGQPGFRLRRASAEWRTWVVVAVAWGLALARAVLRASAVRF